MTLYEYLQNQKNFCEIMAAQSNIDTNLCAFYARAAEGYETKLNNLTLKEAAK